MSKPASKKRVVSLQQEFAKASVSYDAHNRKLQSIFGDLTSGLSLNTDALNEISNEIVSSVFRNEHAMTILTRIKDKHSYNWRHMINCTIFTAVFAKYLGYKREVVQELAMGALMHDLGQAKLPQGIFSKPGKVTGNEMTAIKKHVAQCLGLLKGEKGITTLMLDMIVNHHERLDGSGYPRGVDDSKISRPARILFTPSSSSLRHQNRALIGHFKNQRVWFAMLIGGLNFALFVNLYSVMGFRLVSEPHNVPVGLASLIFICYLGGTFSSRCAGHWSKRYSSILGMFLGAIVSMTGMWIAAVESLTAMLAGLLLISFGAFFTHTLAYGWVGQNATRAKATATALYLVHYYVGGSLGGFLLLYCWQHGGWSSVLMGGSAVYLAMFAAIAYLKHIAERKHTDQTPDAASLKSS